MTRNMSWEGSTSRVFVLVGLLMLTYFWKDRQSLKSCYPRGDERRRYFVSEEYCSMKGRLLNKDDKKDIALRMCYTCSLVNVIQLYYW